MTIYKHKSVPKDKRVNKESQDEKRPLSAIETVHADASESPHVVILGDPGSGKTTFVNHLSLCLAACIATPDQNWLKRIPGWPGNTAFLPVPVILRDFVNSITEPPAKADVAHLWNFIYNQLKARNLDFAAELILKALDDGTAVVLLDGLDEIPGGPRTEFVKQAIVAFARRYQRSSMIVTCRVLSYESPERRLPGFTAHELAPFDPHGIDQFIQAWYTELYRLKNEETKDATERLSKRLQKAVRRPDLWRLAPNPLLLTVMAVVHTHKGCLPQARALLYEECVEMLLYRWDQSKSDSSGETPRMQDLLAEAGRTEMDLKRKLWELAFQCHGKCGLSKNDDAVADIGEWRLVKAMRALHPQKTSDWGDRIIATIKHRAGLLLEREPEVYAFPHRTFQEYLAGAHLASRADYTETTLRKLTEQGTLWREAILLSVGRLVHVSGETDKPLALVMALCPKTESDDDVSWYNAWIAGDVLMEIGINRVNESTFGNEPLNRVRSRLKRLLEKGRLTPLERAEAGNTLSRLGDPRFDPDLYYLPKEENRGFIPIAQGSFYMGTREEDIEKLKKRFNISWNIEDETPRHKVWLETYSIARYPVTKAQFRVFAQSGDYEGEGAWEKYGEENHPVVNVSWYDAVEYCKWLSAKLLNCCRKIRLPTEAEWEKAARRSKYLNFPYDDDDDPDKMNYSKTGIRSTSPVGCFPRGVSPYGISDMAGNVDEWCHDGIRKYSENSEANPLGATEKGAGRAIRGGSWDGVAGNCRTANRYGYGPGNRSRNQGFRLVCLPLVIKDSKEKRERE